MHAQPATHTQNGRHRKATACLEMELHAVLLLARPQSIIAHTGASVRSLPLSTSWLAAAALSIWLVWLEWLWLWLWLCSQSRAALRCSTFPDSTVTQAV
jgi:hypothetical protein